MSGRGGGGNAARPTERIPYAERKLVRGVARRGDPRGRPGYLLPAGAEGDRKGRPYAFLPQKACKILFLEEEIRAGGMGVMMIDALRELPICANKQLISMGAPGFVVQERDEPILKSAGLDAEAIAAQILQ